MGVVLLSIISSLITLDKYAFGEFGFSQPIISGTIIGLIFGDVKSGIFLGAMFQLAFLGGLPIGTEIPPDGPLAGVVGCGTFFLLKRAHSLEQALFLSLVFALLIGIIGGAFEIYTRKFNEKLYRLFLRKESLIYLCHFAGLGTALLRSLLLILPVFIIARYLVIPNAFPGLSKDLFIVLGLSVGLANGIYLFIKRTTVIYLITGVICGLALLAF